MARGRRGQTRDKPEVEELGGWDEALNANNQSRQKNEAAQFSSFNNQEAKTKKNQNDEKLGNKKS